MMYDASTETIKIVAIVLSFFLSSYLHPNSSHSSLSAKEAKLLLMPLLSLLLLLLIPLTLALNDEALALLYFKSSIENDPTNSLSNWNSSSSDPDAHPCSWNGVTCNMLSAVISLSLPKSNLYGSLPSSLFSGLPSLRHLNLRNNHLHGPLPSSLPSASALQSLVLYGNSLSGALPSDLGNLSFLQILDLSSNSFNGSIPNSLTECKRLRTLDLSRNNFTGPLPVGFGSGLIRLEKLDLSWNKLGGSIPNDIGNLSSLQGTADFSHNSFSGPIPASLGDLPEKVYIDLSYNDLRGPIPQNGALENRGPTAFIGNPGLCGPPLSNHPCSSSGPSSSSSSSSSSIPFFPGPGSGASYNAGGTSSSKGLSRGAVVAIVASDVVGIGLIALVFFYCYLRAISKDESSRSSIKTSKGRKQFICFRKEEEISDTLSENAAEQHDLVPLDKRLSFDLDELLKASAFVLSKSGIGIVYKVVLDDGLTLAVRRLGEGGSQRFKEFQSEVETIGKVRHQNIVTLRAYYWSIDEKLLVYDYIPNGNLSAALHGSVEFEPLSWDIRLKIMRGIAKGLAYLHEVSPKKYVHGDLKPSNILLGLKMEPYISDFGVGRLANIAGGSPLVQSSDASVSPTITIASCYQAPEALKKTPRPSQKWDVYSFGAILLELVSGRSPIVLMETLEMDLVRWVQLCIEEERPLADVLDPFLSHELDAREEDEIIAVLKVALTCVQANPEKRPAMRNVLDALEKLSSSSSST